MFLCHVPLQNQRHLCESNNKSWWPKHLWSIQRSIWNTGSKGLQTKDECNGQSSNEMYWKKNTTKKECYLQVVKLHNHRVNAAEQAIQTFKDAFIAVLATTDSEFPLQLWDKVALQVQNTLNLLQASRINPNILANEALNGPYNGDRYPSCHLVVKPSFMKHQQHKGHGHCKVQMHGKWVPLKTNTNATCVTSPKHTHIVFPAWWSSFHNISKSQTWATWHTWKHLPKSLKRPQVLQLKCTRGTHSFTS